MKKSKFYELINTFDKKQLQELSQLIQSNKDENLIVLFKHLTYYLSNKSNKSNKSNDDGVSREDILRSLYKNKLDEKKLQKILNDGVKLCEWVIIKQNIENDKYKQQLILANYYQKHQLEKYFNQHIQSIKEEIKFSKETSNTYYHLYRLEHLAIEQELKSNLRNNNYSNLSTYLNTFYEIEQLKIKCVTFTNLHNDLQLLPVKSILYQQYHNCYTLLKSETEEEYIKFWNELLIDAERIEKADLGLIVNIFYSFCINQLNKNNSVFYEHLLNAYIFSLDKNTAFEENGLLLPSHYKNIITISLRLGRIDFAYQFAQDYKNYLPEEDKEDVYNYNLAHIYFYQMKYDNVLTLLAQIKFTDIFYKISSRVLQIKTYAEFTLLNAKYDDVLESSLNAFKKYIYTNKEINDTYATNYKNFYKIMNKILSISKTEAVFLIEEIIKIKNLAESLWLISFVKRKYNIV